MDSCAELTLRIARLAQQHRVSRRPMDGWFLVPEFRKASWSEALDILAAAPKPLIVSPLIEPGYLAIWSVGQVDANHRSGAERNRDNLAEYFAERLRHSGLGDADSIVLDSGDSELRLSVAEFKRWVSDYAIAVGVTLDEAPEPGVGRILIRPPGGGGPPLGMPTTGGSAT